VTDAGDLTGVVEVGDHVVNPGRAGAGSQYHWENARQAVSLPSPRVLASGE
jgi:hypothetical protein